MIKLLQRKFIYTAMIAISLLLVVLLGAVNGLNAWASSNQIDRMLQITIEKETFTKMKPYPPVPKEGFFNHLKRDESMEMVYFVVRLNGNLENTFIDLSRISSIEEETALNYAKEVATANRKTGKIDKFRYCVQRAKDSDEMVYVFIDTSLQRNAVIRVFVISILIGILCFFIMLLLVVLLSRKAIAPIAMNMERQKQFVTDAGHEIKTPLAIILANTDALELHVGETKWSKNIRTQINRLTGLTQNMLLLVKMEEGTTDPFVEEIDLCQIVKDGIGLFRESIVLRQIIVETDIKESIRIKANQDLLTRLISILLDNAVKYVTLGGKICVSLEQTEHATVLCIKNSFDPTNDQNFDRWFDRFYRGDHARTQSSGGYGIGLSAAKAIVEKHKGKISVSLESHDMIQFKVTFI